MLGAKSEISLEKQLGGHNHDPLLLSSAQMFVFLLPLWQLPSHSSLLLQAGASVVAAWALAQPPPPSFVIYINMIS